MSQRVSLSSGRDLDKLLKNYINSHNIDFFLKLCDACLTNPKDAKYLFREKKFTKELITSTEYLLKRYIEETINFEEFFSTITPILRSIQKSKQNKKFNFNIEHTFLETLFSFIENIKSKSKENPYFLAKLCYLILQTIESLITHHGSNPDYLNITFLRINELLEQAINQSFQAISLIPLNKTEILAYNQLNSPEEYTDILLYILEIYLISIKD